MTQASFPSTAFPDFPSVTVENPGWQTRPVAGALLALVDDRGPAAFSPNVIVGVTRHPAGHTIDDARAAVDEYAKTLAELAPIGSATVEFGGREWSVAEFAYASDLAGTVIQVIAVAVVESGPVADVVRITGTATPADQEQSLPVIRSIIASAQVAPR